MEHGDGGKQLFEVTQSWAAVLSDIEERKREQAILLPVDIITDNFTLFKF